MTWSRPVVDRQARAEARDAERLSMIERLQRAAAMRPADKPRVLINVATQQAIQSYQKTTGRRNQALRDSANGEPCTVRIPGVCSGDPTHTIWSHAPLGAAGKGGAIKALDLCGAYCCTECDAAVDQGRGLPAGYTRDMALMDWFYGHMRSLVRARQKGVI